MKARTDVAIVGAGPTGLLLAGDLAAAGVQTTVLERRTEDSNLTRAFGVHARTMELLDTRGLADALAGTGAHLQRLRLFARVRLDLSSLASRFPYLLVTPQYHVERLLEERAVHHGARLVRGAEVVGLEQDGAGVDLRLRRDEGDSWWHAQYVVGADGHNSAVRHALGLPFPGTSVLRSIMLADVRLTEPPEDVLAVNGVGDAFAFVAPFGDGWYRIFAWDRLAEKSDHEPLGLDEIRDVTRRALGTDFGMHDPRWMSRFHSDERQVPAYRVGRVFLAGDAAHVHSPAGGQGMNTGLQDAANLSWKLAAVVQGRTGDAVLDTYQSERHPVGRMVLRSSGALIRLAMLRSALGRVVRDRAGAVAMRVPPIARRATEMVSGIGIRYPRPRGAHRLVGTRTADVLLADGGRLYERLRSGRFVLVADTEIAPVGDFARRWAPALEHAVPADPAALAILVRPDGYVAWAAEPEHAMTGLDALRAALEKWVGLNTSSYAESS